MSSNVICSAFFANLTPPFTPSFDSNIPALIKLLNMMDKVGLGILSNSDITLVEMYSVSPRLILSEIKASTSIDLEKESE
jgi:hypothetical protein